MQLRLLARAVARYVQIHPEEARSQGELARLVTDVLLTWDTPSTSIDGTRGIWGIHETANATAPAIPAS